MNTINNNHDQNITCTLPPHMVIEMALAMLAKWVELEHVQREQPTQQIDFITLVQCFNKLGMLRATSILQENDTNYLLHLKFKYSPIDAAKHYILHGCLPDNIDQQVIKENENL